MSRQGAKNAKADFSGWLGEFGAFAPLAFIGHHANLIPNHQ